MEAGEVHFLQKAYDKCPQDFLFNKSDKRFVDVMSIVDKEKFDANKTKSMIAKLSSMRIIFSESDYENGIVSIESFLITGDKDNYPPRNERELLSFTDAGFIFVNSIQKTTS